MKMKFTVLTKKVFNFDIKAKNICKLRMYKSPDIIAMVGLIIRLIGKTNGKETKRSY